MGCVESLARIVVGSRNQFTLVVQDECGRPISLSPYTSGKLVFCNQAGVRTEIDLDAVIPGSNPDRGEIPVDISATESEDADCRWKSADLELDDGSSDPVIIPINDQFEIVERNCPPVSP